MLFGKFYNHSSLPHYLHMVSH